MSRKKHTETTPGSQLKRYQNLENQPSCKVLRPYPVPVCGLGGGPLEENLFEYLSKRPEERKQFLAERLPSGKRSPISKS